MVKFRKEIVNRATWRGCVLNLVQTRSVCNFITNGLDWAQPNRPWLRRFYQNLILNKNVPWVPISLSLSRQIIYLIFNSTAHRSIETVGHQKSLVQSTINNLRALSRRKGTTRQGKSKDAMQFCNALEKITRKRGKCLRNGQTCLFMCDADDDDKPPCFVQLSLHKEL